MSIPNLPKPDETWPESALKANQELMKLVLAMGEKIDELERQLKLNSKTSSKPPSTDRNRRSTTKKGKSGRAIEGQKGHKGSTRSLLEPDEVILCQPSDDRCICGGSWVGREALTRIQVTDIPDIRPTVTEYHERCFSCACCGRETYARANLPLGESRFGPKIHAFVLDLNLGSRLSYRQIKGHPKRHHNISVSVGAVSEMIKRSAALTKTAFEDLKRWFQEDMSPKHVDETSWRLRDLKNAAYRRIKRSYCALPVLTPTQGRGRHQAHWG